MFDTAAHLRKTDTRVTVATSNIYNFGVLQRSPVEVITQNGEAVVDCNM